MFDWTLVLYRSTQFVQNFIQCATPIVYSDRFTTIAWNVPNWIHSYAIHSCLFQIGIIRRIVGSNFKMKINSKHLKLNNKIGQHSCKLFGNSEFFSVNHWAIFSKFISSEIVKFTTLNVCAFIWFKLNFILGMVIVFVKLWLRFEMFPNKKKYNSFGHCCFCVAAQQLYKLTTVN